MVRERVRPSGREAEEKREINGREVQQVCSADLQAV